ncbi:MAG: type II toxin-antitoxin system MqsR family toxin [Acidobacteriaceae bacterium]|jgi:HTH-type transcriptional regulator/antitoxin MqsA|nr:type II toxin-antitoxin system MqsR family toxin [Acidobacteriaceae bacterium]
MALAPADFYKSMTTYADHRIWQDVYRPHTRAGDVYLKLTVADGLLISVFQGALTMTCPLCGAAELVRDTRDLPYTYKGETTTFPDVVCDYCPACGEAILDLAEARRTGDLAIAFNKQVNAAIVDPGFIGAVREKLDLNQREAAELFGGGVNAFSRYETGKTRPSLALVKLLKLLDRHPDLLDEIKTT